MTGFERNFPSTLRERMNDDHEIFIFQSWLRNYSEQIMNIPSTSQLLYDKDTSRFVHKLENSGLRHAIQRYRAAQATEFDRNIWSNYDPESCSWIQVFDELEKAKKEYESRANNNVFRKAIRKGHGIARNVKPFLEGIPQDDGLGLLKGALLIIFKAVQDRSVAREKIYDSFSSMPKTIIDAERLRQHYPDDESLFFAFQNLNDELIKAIPSLIDVLLRRTEKSKVRALTKSVFCDPVAEVEDILKLVNVAKENLDRCRDNLNTGEIAIIRPGLQLMHENVIHSRDQMSQGFSHVGQQLTQLTQATEEANNINTLKLEELQARRDSVPEDMSLLTRELISTRELVTSLYTLVQERMRITPPYPAPDDSPSTADFMVQDIMETICSKNERTAHVRDLGFVLRKYHEFSPKALGRAKYLMETSEFHGWFLSTGSEILLVDGHCDDQSIGRLAPTSLTCAGLVETYVHEDYNSTALTLAQTPRIILYFFAGEHINSNNGLHGPHGLIRSLVYQLLLQWPEDGLPDPRLFRSQLNAARSAGELSTTSLCFIFEQLVCQLSSDFPVCCIIDGVSYFETSLYGWRDDLTNIVNCFLSCKEAKSAYEGQGTIKFLLVSPDKSTSVWHLINQVDHVDLRAGNMHS
ncbi:hypothetical protein EDB81DRAFT_367857 [Dactylonectria macrodidyma]|uniref:Uncharacterized protein n=1 Tax=Dactylonectria macrodidyma TaxID=307937 RepID=A0A9P9D2A5_9HYPO|nr:hypothetical protein EDB81DRAFT_367857 [Dactylonectria macrodidyma]